MTSIQSVSREILPFYLILHYNGKFNGLTDFLDLRDTVKLVFMGTPNKHPLILNVNFPFPTAKSFIMNEIF